MNIVHRHRPGKTLLVAGLQPRARRLQGAHPHRNTNSPARTGPPRALAQTDDHGRKYRRAISRSVITPSCNGSHHPHRCAAKRPTARTPSCHDATAGRAASRRRQHQRGLTSTTPDPPVPSPPQTTCSPYQIDAENSPPRPRPQPPQHALTHPLVGKYPKVALSGTVAEKLARHRRGLSRLPLPVFDVQSKTSSGSPEI